MVIAILGWLVVGFYSALTLNSYWVGRYPWANHRSAFIVAYIGLILGPILFVAVFISLLGLKFQGEDKVFYPWRLWYK
jgi:hypothetical protein